MSIETIQDILPLVQQPTRYLGSEINTVRKDLNRVELRLALAFPDLYEIGTSHFGLQILYHILNRRQAIAAERVFAPGVDMEGYLRAADIPLMSLESHYPLHRFDIIGFSLLYELNYTNVLNMLDLAKIPFRAAERDLSHPLVIGGGPCACNPEPVADFFDAIVVGDGEKAMVEMADTWLQWKAGGRHDKDVLLRMWSRIEGVYIPAFFESELDGFGFQRLFPKYADYQVVTRAVVDDLDKAPFPEAPILPYGKPVHDRLRLEVARGCTRGCRFCQAGMIYRPVRERSTETLMHLSDRSIATTGYEDISLLSLSTGDYNCIVPLMERLMARCERRHIAVSLPSLRAGTLTPELMYHIQRVRKTGFTIAPEAGSQRLRDAINKNITRQDVIETVRDAFKFGWQVIKLYFMIGLPSETDEDLEAIVDLTKVLRKMKGPRGRKGQINVSVTTFIPKPHTPFQWASQIPLAESKKKIRWLQDRLRMPGIHFKWQNPEVSALEGVWARGDRRLGALLATAHQKGCKFDGWSDMFQYELWQDAFADAGVDMDFFTTRNRDTAEPLPWDHIDTRVTKDFLKEEWEKSLKGALTPDCRQDQCQGCGACDFVDIAPRVWGNCGEEMPQAVSLNTNTKEFYKKLQVSYSKRDQAKYFGHLELVNIFLRALRRARIPVRFSEGFHPMPKVSFEDPLPIGMESLKEIFYIIVPVCVAPPTIMKSLNAHLPAGLAVTDCQPALVKSARNGRGLATYRVTLKDGFFDPNDLNSFFAASECIITRTTRKGKVKRIDLKEMVSEISSPGPQTLQMTLKSESGKTVRPLEVIKNIFRISEEKIKQALMVKMPLDKGRGSRTVGHG